MNHVRLNVKIIKTNMLQKDGYDIFMKLAEKGNLPHAIFSVNDSLANGIYQAASKLGLNILGDIAVTGFGNIEISKLLQPLLTTFNIPVEEMIEFAINKLIGMIQNKDVEKDRKVFSGFQLYTKSDRSFFEGENQGQRVGARFFSDRSEQGLVDQGRYHDHSTRNDDNRPNSHGSLWRTRRFGGNHPLIMQ